MDTKAHDESSTTGRRRLLRAVGIGGALAALPVIARSATAGGLRPRSTDTTVAGETTETTQAARAFAHPTEADVELLAFAQSVELAAVELYAVSAEALAGEPVTTAQIVDVFGDHRKAYAHALSGLLGRDAGNVANAALVEQLRADFSDADSLVESALALEDAAVATHLQLLGELGGTDGATLVAAIVAGEARHAAALRAVAGDDPMPTAAAADTSAALSAADFPVEG